MLPRIPELHLKHNDQLDRPLRLMSVVRARLRERHYSRRTEETYVHWIVRFIRFHERRHPRDMGVPEIRAFLTSLAVDGQVSASTQNLARAALKFLYDVVLAIALPDIADIVPAKRSRRLPVVLSPREIRAIMQHLEEPVSVCVGLMYGSGLRIHECVSLRVKDIDVDRREIVVRGGKGDKDRRVPLAESVIPRIRHYLRRAAESHRRDRQLGIRTTGITTALATKFPNAEKDWPWQYIFPATRTLRDADGLRRRHHLHETVIQRAFRQALIASGIAKRATCHSLPFVRDAPVGIRGGYSDGAGAARAHGFEDDDDLYACAQSRRAWGAESGGQPVAWLSIRLDGRGGAVGDAQAMFWRLGSA